MSVLYVVVPLAIVLVGAAVAAFVWAARAGQFDDLETPARRMLFDDDPVPSEEIGPTDERSGASHSLVRQQD